MPNLVKGLSAGAIALIGLGLILAWLDMNGYSNYDTEFLGAKALQALSGAEPRYRAIVSIFPPLLVYSALMVGSAITLQALLGAIAVGLIVWQMGNIAVAPIWRSVWAVLIVFNPAFSLMLLRSPVWVAVTIFLALLMSVLWMLAKGKETPSLPTTLLLVLLGLGLAPLMLLRYETWLLLPAIAAIVLLLFPAEAWDFRITAALVTLFMSLVLIATWLYMNWMFTGDAYYFLNSHYSGMRLAETKVFLQQEDFVNSWWQSFAWLVQVVPVYLAIAAWTIWKSKQKLLFTAILLLPVMLLVAGFFQGSFMPEVSRFGVFLGILPPIVQLQTPTKFWQHSLLTAALVVNLIIGASFLQQDRVIPEEAIFWRQITRQEALTTIPVQEWLQQKQAQRQIAQVLYEKLLPGQKVLLDDGVNFPIIYMLNDASYFILPYQNEFFLALQQPDLLTDYILIPGVQTRGSEQDRILSYWPQLAETTLPGFQEVFGSPHYKLLQRLSQP
jgi:4-amino-4-deoxy-L-arabinose transferase-like glycosyltransferase